MARPRRPRLLFLHGMTVPSLWRICEAHSAGLHRSVALCENQGDPHACFYFPSCHTPRLRLTHDSLTRTAPQSHTCRCTTLHRIHLLFCFLLLEACPRSNRGRLRIANVFCRLFGDPGFCRDFLAGRAVSCGAAMARGASFSLFSSARLLRALRR